LLRLLTAQMRSGRCTTSCLQIVEEQTTARYLSPIVLERLIAHRRPCSLSIKDLIAAAERPWCEQEALVFEN
jgi:hypothetical protein